MLGKSLDNGETFQFLENVAVIFGYCKLKDLVLVLREPKYCLPPAKSQGAYDSFYWDGANTFFLIQITTAENHNILNSAVKEFSSGLKI
jgi:hypothetical protein